MLCRRWLQFSLRFLFAATFLGALVVWWFRPGVVKPEFSLERFSHEIDANSGKKKYYADIRLTNSGPDAIWLRNGQDCKFEMDMDASPTMDQDGKETVFRYGIHQMACPVPPLRLRPHERNAFTIEIKEGDQFFSCGVDITDRRQQRERTYWSQTFAIPDDLFSSPTP